MDRLQHHWRVVQAEREVQAHALGRSAVVIAEALRPRGVTEPAAATLAAEAC